eukprot:86942-Rhodomonas_salina.1
MRLLQVGHEVDRRAVKGCLDQQAPGHPDRVPQVARHAFDRPCELGPAAEPPERAEKQTCVRHN